MGRSRDIRTLSRHAVLGEQCPSETQAKTAPLRRKTNIMIEKIVVVESAVAHEPVSKGPVNAPLTACGLGLTEQPLQRLLP